MDNQKSYIPRLREKSKEMTGTERLPSKISGCNIYSGWYESKRKCLFFINHDQVLLDHYFYDNELICSVFQFENASDMIVSLVFLLIEEFLQDHKKLPRKLHLNLGKSSKFFLMPQLSIELGIFFIL